MDGMGVVACVVEMDGEPMSTGMVSYVQQNDTK